MIKSIKILREDTSATCGFTKINNHKFEINDIDIIANSYTLIIEFKNVISSFRNHDYAWAGLSKSCIANWYAPKILRLDNNQIVQANQTTGIWEINEKAPKILLWHFNPINARPIVNYDEKNHKIIKQASTKKPKRNPLALLFPKISAIEISRSKIAFSAIACFTDHCDFDTYENLKLQRRFFYRHNIKVTKGFFLNNYSKRKNTASYEQHSDEIEKWLKDGHELAYHSLSQSIKPIKESIDDFFSFNPPIENITTWIDHGFQPYNFTMANHKDELKNVYGSTLKKKRIHTVWNYIDSGTSVNGVINQLNPKHFTLGAYYEGIRHLGLKKATALLVKAIIFQYHTADAKLRVYRNIARYVKSFNLRKGFNKHLKFIRDAINLMAFVVPVLAAWKFNKNKTYSFAKFAPLLFNHDLNGETFTVFQTVEMIDFKKALNKNNIDLLIKESGLFIGHTYFSAPMNYHEGKLFANENEVDSQVEKRFKYLSEKIQNGLIWNPTLNELVTHITKLEQISYNCTDDGTVYIENEHTFNTREVK